MKDTGQCALGSSYSYVGYKEIGVIYFLFHNFRHFWREKTKSLGLRAKVLTSSNGINITNESRK